jgi:hypothetical protein
VLPSARELSAATLAGCAGSIGELYCSFLADASVRGSMRVAAEEMHYWRATLSPAWAKMCADADFAQRFRMLFIARAAGVAAPHLREYGVGSLHGASRPEATRATGPALIAHTLLCTGAA